MAYPNPPPFVLTDGQSKVCDMRQRMLDHPISWIVKAVDAGSQVVCEISNSAGAIDTPDDAAVIWAPSGAGTIVFGTNQEIVRYAPCNAIRFKVTGGGAIIEQKG